MPALPQRSFKLRWSRKRFTAKQRASWLQCACGQYFDSAASLTVHAESLCPVMTGKRVVVMNSG